MELPHTSSSMENNLYLAEAIQYHRNQYNGGITRFLYPGTTLCTLLVVCIVTIAILFMANSTYTRKQALYGHIDSHHVASVSASGYGRIKTLQVTEGNQVDVGMPLAILSRGNEIESEARRDLLAEVEKQFIQTARDKKSAGLVYEIEIKRAESLHSNLSDRLIQQQLLLKLQQQLLEQSQNQYRAASSLKVAGYLSELEWTRAEQNLLLEQQEILKLQQSSSLLSQQLQDLEQQKSELPIRFAQQVSLLEQKLSDLRQSRTQLLDEDHQQLTAPVKGQISVITVQPGTAVSKGEVLISIIPESRTITATLYVPTFAYHHVRGQHSVQLRLEDSPNSEMTVILGKIVYISEHPIPDMEGNPVFLARVELSDHLIDINGEEVPLKSGMSLFCSVPLATLTLLEWLIHPLRVLNKGTLQDV